MGSASRFAPKPMAQRQFFTNSGDPAGNSVPRLDILAGPNVSGKSTFAQDVREGRRAIDHAIPVNIISHDVVAHG
jgi:hypothetical protein